MAKKDRKIDMSTRAIDIDELAQEIRRVDGNHDLGAGALAEALAPYIEQQIAMHVAAVREDVEDDAPPAGAMRPIPVKAAGEIAKRYGYDQVIVLARRVGEGPAPNGEHVTTYGRNAEHCQVAAGVGDFLKHKIMGWPQLHEREAPARAGGVLAVLRSYSAPKAVAAARAFEALLKAYRALLASHRDYTESQARGWPGPASTYPDREWASRIEREAEAALAQAEG